MTDLLAAGRAWLATARKSYAGQALVYSRGSDTVAVTGTRGNTNWDVLDEGGAAVRWESADWLFAVADLVLSGSRIEPRRGDRITETVGSTVYTYEVVAPPGLAVWSYQGGREMLRVHSKLISTA